MNWDRYWRISLVVAAAVTTALYAFVLVVDPFDTVPFSPDFEREPISTNQRYSYPALARKAKFDSAIIGTSSVRLLNPAELNPLFEARFVNLAMNSATAYEQSRILDVFARNHPGARAVLFGVDRTVWCIPGADRFTFRPFPPWMYDENPWNDLPHLLNGYTLEQAARQFGRITGLRAPKYGRDGYTRFVPPADEYDLAKARRYIYGSRGVRMEAPVVPAVVPTEDQTAMWRYETHDLMRGMLRRLPPQTLKIMLFVPYHQVWMPTPGSLAAARVNACKDDLVALGDGVENFHAVDFMHRSSITVEDTNYWDLQHYTVETASRIARYLAEAVTRRTDRPDIYRYLSDR